MFGPQVHLIIPKGAGELPSQAGLLELIELIPGESTAFDGVRIQATPPGIQDHVLHSVQQPNAWVVPGWIDCLFCRGHRPVPGDG
jgi:hypothetical protein